jgi:hypothetical protein
MVCLFNQHTHIHYATQYTALPAGLIVVGVKSGGTCRGSGSILGRSLFVYSFCCFFFMWL